MSKTIGVTGPGGFVARWAIERLGRDEACEVVTLDRASWEKHSELRDFVARCDVILHLAGINRADDTLLENGNAELARLLTAACREAGATPHIVYSSTTKREEDSPYGRGKRKAESELEAWAAEMGGAVTTLVIPNVYGAGCRPYYNSAVATFCHQLTHDEQPRVHEDREIELLWVSDLADCLAEIALNTPPTAPVIERLQGDVKLRVTELLAVLEEFRVAYFDRDVVPNLTTPWRASLYGTFLSHLELDDHRHRPPVHTDERGGLCEVIKTDGGGQVFFSTTAPGVTRGNHYHTRKIEWFCVVRGEATIRLRAIGGDAVHEFHVTGASPEFISIPVMHTHSIENTGDDELLTMFWCNELFDADDADTHYLPVAA